MNFGEALDNLKRGLKVARKGWNGKSMWIAMEEPEEDDSMTLPYLYIEYPEGHPAHPEGCRVPWLASQTDILAEDWSEVAEEKI